MKITLDDFTKNTRTENTLYVPMVITKSDFIKLARSVDPVRVWVNAEQLTANIRQYGTSCNLAHIVPVRERVYTVEVETLGNFWAVDRVPFQDVVLDVAVNNDKWEGKNPADYGYTVLHNSRGQFIFEGQFSKGYGKTINEFKKACS